MPLVSVILLTYNHESYLRQSIESILMQKVDFEYEIVVAEDFSTDRTRDIINEYSERNPGLFNILFRIKNIGATKNLYEAYMRSKGKYITILEGDDYWIDEYKLERQIRFLEENMQYIGIAHKIRTCDENGNLIPTKKRNREFINEAATIKDYRKYGFLFHTSTIMFRNIFLDNQNQYKKLLTSHPLVGDRPLFFLLFDKGSIYITDDIVSTFRWVKKAGAGNARSIAYSNPIRSSIGLIRQTLIMEEFFKGKYDFTLEKKKMLALLWKDILSSKQTNPEQKKEAWKLIKGQKFIINFKAIGFLIYKGFEYPFKKKGQ
jgi:glycosyltransferase involved in cell wall biosynthesis